MHQAVGNSSRNSPGSEGAATYPATAIGQTRAGVAQSCDDTVHASAQGMAGGLVEAAENHAAYGVGVAGRSGLYQFPTFVGENGVGVAAVGRVGLTADQTTFFQPSDEVGDA